MPGDAQNASEGVFGLGVIGNDAGVASAFPDPSTDVTFPWMHWQRFVVGDPSTNELATGEAVRWNVDVKAQRRLRDSLAELRFVVDNDDGTHTFQFSIGFRTLLKLA